MPLAMAVSCAIATNRERNATSKAIEPDSTQPVVSSAEADASRSERHFCVKILGNLRTQAPLKRVLQPFHTLSERDFAWVCRIFSGRRRTGRWYRVARHGGLHDARPIIPGSGQRWKTACKTPMIPSGGTPNELHG